MTTSGTSWVEIASVGGTWGALVLALTVSIGEARQRRRDAADQQAAQARMLIVQVKRVDSEHAEVRATNYSQEPVLDLRLTSVSAAGAWAAAGYRLRGRSDQDSADVEADSLTRMVLGPGQSIVWPIEFISGDQQVLELGQGIFVATCRFLDAHGLRWVSGNDRQPTRVRSSARR